MITSLTFDIILTNFLIFAIYLFLRSISCCNSFSDISSRRVDDRNLQIRLLWNSIFLFKAPDSIICKPSHSWHKASPYVPITSHLNSGTKIDVVCFSIQWEMNVMFATSTCGLMYCVHITIWEKIVCRVLNMSRVRHHGVLHRWDYRDHLTEPPHFRF